MKTTKYVMLTLLLAVSQLGLAKSVVTEFKVEGQCGDCKSRIEKALDLPGISFATWDVDSKMITIRYNDKRFSETDIHSIISELGYATEKQEANQTAEDALPKCCRPGGAKHCAPKE